MRLMADLAAIGRNGSCATPSSSVFDRQVRAFGEDFQQRLQRLRVGVVGVGGLGSAIVEQLARLGIHKMVLVDPDRVEYSNLNRLIGSTAMDVRHQTAKTEIGRRLVAGVHEEQARVTTWNRPVDDPDVVRSLAACDMIVAATDNHASRLVVQEIGVAYLRPMLNAGVGLEGQDGLIQRILGRASSPPVAGPWCLYCRGIVDPNRAARESADHEHQAVFVDRGYLPGTPDPAVVWVNGGVASLAVSMLHDRVHAYRSNNPARDVLLDLLNLETLSLAEESAPEDCTVCGSNGLRGLGDAWLRDRYSSTPDDIGGLLLNSRLVVAASQ